MGWRGTLNLEVVRVPDIVSLLLPSFLQYVCFYLLRDHSERCRLAVGASDHNFFLYGSKTQVFTICDLLWLDTVKLSALRHPLNLR